MDSSEDDDDGINPMVAKFNDDDEDVEIDNYESLVTKVRELSDDDSGSEDVKKNKLVSKECDDLDNFLNEDDTVNSMHQDYESI